MADRSNSFRTVLSGFHKGDVAKYIEKISAQHRAELNERDKIIEAQEMELNTLRQQLEQQQAAPAVVEVEATPSLPNNISELELQAYRRAEAAERLANNRARNIYTGLESMAEATLSQFKTADAAVKQAVETILSQNAAMEEAYSALSVVLTESRQQLAQIDPLIAEPETIE